VGVAGWEGVDPKAAVLGHKMSVAINTASEANMAKRRKASAQNN